MIPAWWSLTLAAIGLLGIWMAGRRDPRGWFVGAGAQLLWIAYALVTDQPGFILTAVAYGYLYLRNGLAWRRG